MKAIAAMSLNRVIGKANAIPWHLPKELKWFKQMTTGQVIVMGRRTFESIGKPLPNRTTIVLSRTGFQHPATITVGSLSEIDFAHPAVAGREVFICGGAQVYAQALPRCAELFLTQVKQVVDGDAVFPPFEADFQLVEVIREGPEFTICRYRNRSLGAWLH